MTHRSDNARHVGIHRPVSPPAPQVPEPQAQLARLRNNLLGGFGQGASTDQVRAQTRDRPAANPPPPPFEQALQPAADRPHTRLAATERLPRTAPTAYLASGFLVGVLMSLLLRRGTRR